MNIHLISGLKRRLYILLDSKSNKLSSKVVQGLIVLMILLSVISLVLSSVEEVQARYGYYLDMFSFISVVFFSIEYIIRLWTITLEPRYSKPIVGRLKYSFTPLQLIDLFAILPFYLFFVHFDLRILRLLRVFKLLRIFRIASYVPALSLIVTVLRRKSAELVLSGILLFFLLLISSSAMYYAENSAQPEAFSSIPDSMWWAVITMSTVGYGDVFPITVSGKILGGIISVIGIGFFALPTGILTSGFNEVLQERKKLSERKEKHIDICPTCGKPHDT